MTPDDMTIRAELKRIIPQLKEQASHLRDLLPQRIKVAGGPANASLSTHFDAKDIDANFDVNFEKETKRLRSEQAMKRGLKHSDKPNVKKFKYERTWTSLKSRMCDKTYRTFVIPAAFKALGGRSRWF